MVMNTKYLLLCSNLPNNVGADWLEEKTEEYDRLFIAVMPHVGEDNRPTKGDIISQNLKLNGLIEELIGKKRKVAGAFIPVATSTLRSDNVRTLLLGYKPDVVIVPEENQGVLDPSEDMGFRDIVDRESEEVENIPPPLIITRKMT